MPRGSKMDKVLYHTVQDHKAHVVMVLRTNETAVDWKLTRNESL
jgi:hypothetical protein